MKSSYYRPPAVSAWLLGKMLLYSVRNAALGDLEEQYHMMAEEKGKFQAGLWYRCQAAILLPAFIVDSIYWSIVMLKSYLKSAFRNILRNKLTSSINIVGLSAAIACAVFVFVFIDFMYYQNTFHENAESIFMVESRFETEEGAKLYGYAPVPLGPAIAVEIPQVKSVVRYSYGTPVFRYRDMEFEELVNFVDEDFLHIFTFPLRYGEKDVLREKDAIVLSAELADKYFGDSDPVGEQISMTFNNKNTRIFTVKGVAEELPNNASFNVSALIPYENRRDLMEVDLDDWTVFAAATFIQLDRPEDITAVEQHIQQYVQTYNNIEPDRRILGFHGDPLTDIALNAWNVENSISAGGHPAGRVVIAILGLLILASACFNYVNTAVAAAARRLKEVGIRKVVGSSKANLVAQFIFENLLFCFIALIGGILLCDLVFIPGLNEMIGQTILKIDYIGNPRLWIFLPALLVLTAIGAGSYPAFYVSSLQPVNIFRKKQRIRKGAGLMRFSLTFQFMLSFLTVFTGVAFLQNVRYQWNIDRGFSCENIIAVHMNGKQHYSVFRDAVRGNPDILEISGTVHHIGLDDYSETKIRIGPEEQNIGKFDVGPSFTEMIGLKLKDGRFFSSDISTDIDRAVIVNEKLAAVYNVSIGSLIRIDDGTFTVVGVVEDFHYKHYTEPIEPVVIRPVPESEYRYMSVKAAEGTEKQVGAFLKETWAGLFPDIPFRNMYLSDRIEDYQRQNTNDMKALLITAFIALTISCMELLGLVSLTCSRREKEISIRKVLGASVANIIRLVNREFTLSFLIAVVIMAPLSLYLINSFLDVLYEYYAIPGLSSVAATLGVLILTAVITIGGHVYRAVHVNPVEQLRNE